MGNWLFHSCPVTAIYFEGNYPSFTIMYALGQCGSPAIYRKNEATGWPTEIEIYDRGMVPVQIWTSFPNPMP
jgi:hypothetical protein